MKSSLSRSQKRVRLANPYSQSQSRNQSNLHQYSRNASRNAGRSNNHSRSISRVSVRSDYCYPASTRCLSINFPSKSDHLGRRTNNTPVGFGQSMPNGIGGGARVEQVMVSPPGYSLECDRTKALSRSKKCSSMKRRKAHKGGSKSLPKNAGTSKSRSRRRIRGGKIVDGMSVSASLRRPR